MRTNTKQVSMQIQEHVLSYYNREELARELTNAKIGNQWEYQTANQLVDDGCFLIYHDDVKTFLNGLGINPTNKEYDELKSWNLYKRLLAREIVKLCKVK